MITTLLGRFGITIQGTLDNYNLIGLDYGDGELSAALIEWRQVERKMRLVDLSLNDSGVLPKCPNALKISSDGSKSIAYNAADIQRKDAQVFYNFKRCPGTSECASNYSQDDGAQADMTYAQIMAEQFNVVVRTLFESNPLLILRDRPTIILVGRPSSQGWSNKETIYAQLLESALQLDDLTKQPVRVAVESESWAAMARETDPDWAGGRLKRGEVVVVLDNGSSTFDITVICIQGLAQNGAGEDSYQFGGSQLDANLLKLMMEKRNEDRPGIEFLGRTGHKLGLRFAKETYYGPDGDAEWDNTYQTSLEDGSKFKFEINEEVIKKATGEMPVRVVHYGVPKGDAIPQRSSNYGSWLEGVRAIYQGFYEKMRPLFSTPGDAHHLTVPDRIILSGGVSVMPEVQTIAEEVFGVKPILTDHPNYTVSNGLAYVLGCEIRKANYLKELEDEAKELFADHSYSLKASLVAAGVDEDWEIFRKSMESWAKDPKDSSIQDWQNSFYQPLFNSNLTTSLQEGAKRWYYGEKLEENLSELLKKKFREMFPDYTDAFQYAFPKLDFSGLPNVRVVIRINYSFFFGQMTADEDEHTILSNQSIGVVRNQAWRQSAYQNFLAMENKVRNGGTNSCYYNRTGLISIFARKGHTNVTYDGLVDAFKKGITDEAVEAIRSEIRNRVYDKIQEHVEQITPYFNMTAQQNVAQ